MSLDTAAANDGTRDRRSGLGRGLAFMLVATFFSNAPVYLNLFVAPTIRPMHWMIAFGIGILALWLRPTFWRQSFAAGLPLWALGYASLCIVWFISFGGGDPEVLRQRIVALLFLFVAYLVIGGSKESVAAARMAIGVVVVLSVAINAFDISNPFVLIPAESEFATLGRASGLYWKSEPVRRRPDLGFHGHHRLGATAMASYLRRICWNWCSLDSVTRRNARLRARCARVVDKAIAHNPADCHGDADMRNRCMGSRGNSLPNACSTVQSRSHIHF